MHTANSPSHIIRLKKQAQAYLTKLSEKIIEDSNKDDIVRVKTEIIASIRIANDIVGYPKDKHVDLIIIGTRVRSKLKSIVLRGVTPDVVRHAHCSVLTVR